ncbi:MAG: hypothetical protein GXO73_01980, partial [Calditrichaeota bacterium]|nr:hypothetical protein [Calditrichota bacterium]
MSDVHPEQKQEFLDIPFVDRHQVEVLLEKASRDPDEQLKTHFIRNVFANLEGILDALTDEEAPLKKRLARLLQAAQAVEDLAMIHGYDGIETIAHNMAQAVAAVDPREHETIPELLALKVKMAVEAIQKVLSLSDELNERMIVDSTTSQISELEQYATVSEAAEEPQAAEIPPEPEVHEEPVDEAPPATPEEAAAQVEQLESGEPTSEPPQTESTASSWPLADSLTTLLDDEDESPDEALTLEAAPEEELQISPAEDSAAEESDDVVFDIKEANTLIALMSEEDQSPEEASLDVAQPEEPAQAEPEPGHDGAAAHEMPTSAVPPSAVEDLFADVLRDEAREALTQLNQLLGTKGKVKDEVLENVRFVLESLRETAEKLRYQDIANCAAELLALSSDRVEAGSPLDEKTRELFTQATKALKEFVDGSPSASTRIGLVVERLRGERSPESDEDPLDDAIIMELQKKLTAHEKEKSGGL